MKKTGFTLIELLAVIVILAIIALIATPIILNVIEKAKKGAAESSALGYLSAVENQVAINAVDTSKEDIVDGEYEVSALEAKGVSVKGNAPTSGTVTITKGQVTACSLVIDKYTVTCLGNGKVQVGGEVTNVGPTAVNPDLTKTKGLLKIVYLDPTDLTKSCDSSNSISTTGTKEGCMKWYAYSESDTTYNLILDHNTTPLVAYNSERNNKEIKEAKTALENDTANWKETARLITADEIAEVTGAKDALDWTSDKKFELSPVKGTSISRFYFDGAESTDSIWHTQVATSQGASKYAWLYDNTYGCTSRGCNISDDNKHEYGTSGQTGYIYGYWTSTSVVGDHYAWYVFYSGGLNLNANNPAYINYYVDNPGILGVRPVITISKSIIN